MGILHWDKIPKSISTQEWMKISADSAPPGVYTPNMSKDDMLKWKAKFISGKEKRVEIRKSFLWSNKEKYPNNKNYSSQVLIVVRLNPTDDPDILISTNGKIAMSNVESISLQMAIEEAKLMLQNNK